jgi:hypothetical protein
MENERKGAEASEQAQRRMRAGYQATSQAREVLGVRSEQRIQREIAATEAAYKRLAATGKLSATEQARALDATRAKVTALTNEMGKLTAAQEKAARGANMQQYGGMAVAAGAAGYMALRGPVQQAMAVDERLAHLANTAYRERDVRGKRVGMTELREAVDSATFAGSGTREGTTGALELLLGSGAMTDDQALKILPSLVRAGTAANADPRQLAEIGLRAMQTFKIDPADMPNVLNMALAAGQAGGFELKDMARHLPAQMAAATQSGMLGRAGFAKLAALNQAAAITAGTKDEAGNNVVNLLAKINSADAATNAKQLGVDLPGYLQARRAKGVDSVDAFGELVNQTVARRADYQSLQKQLAAAGNDADKRAALDSMTTIAQGAGIGALIQDRQALMALLGMMNNREYLDRVLADVKANDRGAGGAVDQNYELIEGTGGAKARRRSEAVQGAQDRVLGDGGSVLGAVNDAVADVAAKFPILAGSTALATTAVTAMSGAAGLAAIALARVGGAGGAGLPKGATLGEKGKKYAVRAGAGAGLALGADLLLDKVTDDGSVINRYGKSAAQFAGLGALAGPWGVAAGAAIGIALQGWKDMQAKKDDAPTKPAPTETKVSLQLGLPPGMVVQQQSTQTLGSGTFGMSVGGTGNIMTGVPQ